MRRFASSWSGTLSKLGFRRKRARCKNRQGVYHRRPAIESLEPRQLLSITVNTLVDENNGIGVGGISLREAIGAAIPGDTIEFSVAGTIHLTNQLTINKNLTLIGPGKDLLTISSNGQSRVFQILSPATTMLSGLTITGGGGVNRGAGIYNAGNLTLDHVRVTQNHTLGGLNDWQDDGGGIYSLNGSLHVLNSTIDSNVARFDAGIGFDGGAGNILEIVGSTVSGNIARYAGGYAGAANGGLGINATSTASLAILNSTFSGNLANNNAGIIVDGSAHLEITNSTITGNEALSISGGITAYGAGSQITLHNTIVAGNIDHDPWNGIHRDVAKYLGTFAVSSSYNLIGVVGQSGISNAIGNHNQLGLEQSPMDPKLAPLGDYGGHTKTHALLPSSLAIDAGNNAYSSQIIDQRGFKRIVDQGLAGPIGGTIDVGAYEYGLIVSKVGDESDGNYGEGELTLREALTLANVNPDRNEIQFHAGLLSGRTIELIHGELAINSDVAIVGLGNDITIDAKDQSRVLNISSGKVVTVSGLTITGGGGVNRGAGIYNSGNLTLDQVRVTQNQTRGDIDDWQDNGGGIYSLNGSLLLLNSTVDSNSARFNAGIGFAGGAGNALEIVGSTVSGNIARYAGGYAGAANGGLGINATNTASLSIVSSTFSGNVANNNAGIQVGGTAQLAITNSTITGNEAFSVAGGITVSDLGSQVTLQNTIVAGNIDHDPWDGIHRDVAKSLGTFAASSSYNLIGVVGQSGIPNAVGNHNQLGSVQSPQDPGLAPLGDYGGPTKTHALLPGSLAIDAGNKQLVTNSKLLVDQRGFVRLVDDGPVGPSDQIVDIGALESGQVIATSADFDGNGYNDHATYDPVTRTIVAFLGTAQATNQVAITKLDRSAEWDHFQVGDFNGDQRDDIWFRKRGTNNWSIAISDGSQFNVSDLSSAVTTGTWATTFKGDFDGDGAVELLGWNSTATHWEVLDYDDHDGMKLQSDWGQQLGAGSQPLQIGDVNRDGRDDLLRYDINNGWRVAMSEVQADGSSKFVTKTGPEGNWHPWFVNFDINNNEVFTVDADAPYKKLLEIFSEVYNNIELELYPGLMKGITATAETKAGNDWDQAALLVDRLDNAGFDSQIVFGKLDAPLDEVRKWLGVDTNAAALNVIKSTMDAEASIENDTTVLRFKHAWVQLKVPTASGMLKVYLDPSWKFKDRQESEVIDLSNAPTGYTAVTGRSARGTFDEFGFLANADENPLPFEWYEDQVANYLSSAGVHKSLAEVAYDRRIIHKTFDELPQSTGKFLDSEVVLTPATSTELFENLSTILSNGTNRERFAHRASITLNQERTNQTGSTDVYFRWTINVSIPQVGLSSIYVDYEKTENSPSTSSDDTFRSRIFVNNNLWVQDGASAFYVSDTAKLTISHQSPSVFGIGLSLADNIYTRAPGQILAISFDANQYSREHIVGLQAGLNGILDNGSDVSDIDNLLSYTAAKYWYDFNRSNKEIDALMHTVGGQQWVGSGIVTSDPYLLNSAVAHLQFPIVPQNMGVDLPNLTHASLYAGLGANHSNEAFQLVGYNASSLENAILEEVVDSESISTIRGLKNAYGATPGDWVWVFESRWENGQRNIYRLGPIGNASGKPTPAYSPTGGTLISQFNATNAGLTNHSTDVVSSIGNILANVNQSATQTAIIRILVPNKRSTVGVTVGGWSGSVYVAEFETPTGKSAAYIIWPDGGTPTNGGYSGNNVAPPNLNLPTGSFANQTYHGDPVSVANGNMFRDELDFKFANPVIPLDFSRHYDSQNKLDIGFGAGWVHGFTGFVYQEADPAHPGDFDYVWLNGKGERHVFENENYDVPNTLYGLRKKSTVGLTEFQDKDGTRYIFTPIAGGFLDPGTGKQVYARLTSITNAAGDQGVTISYIGNSVRVDTVASISSPSPTGRNLKFEYNADNTIARIKRIEAGQTVSTWQFIVTTLSALPSSNNKRLTQVKQASENSVVTNYEYYTDGPDSRKGLIKKIIEPNGESHTYEYYANGRVFRVIDGEGNQQTYSYNLFRNLTEATNERGNVETYIYQDNGLTTRQIHPDRSRQEFSWGTADTLEEFLMKSSTDEQGAKETFTYSQLGEANYHPGNLKQSIAKDGLVTNYEYWTSTVAANQYISRLSKTIVDPDLATGSKLTTQYTYDVVGNLLSATDAEGHRTDYQYFGASDGAAVRGLRKSETLPNGVETVFQYDTAGNIFKAITESLPATARTYDTFGNVKTEEDATGVITYNTYDALGRLIKTVVNNSQNPDLVGVSTTTIAYNPWRIQSTTDALGHVTTNLYDANGRLIKQTFADGMFTKHEYDEAGNRVAVTDELGHTTRFIYDDRNRVIQTIYADGTSTHTRYDGTGRIVESTDELGRDIQFKYDRVGRLLETTRSLRYPETSSTTTPVVMSNQYDHLGNLVKVTDPEGNVTVNQFDKLGRIIESRTLKKDASTGHANPSLTPVAVMTTNYDANGRVEKRVAYETAVLGTQIPTKYVNPAVNFESSALLRFQGASNNLDTIGTPNVVDGGRTLVLNGNSRKAVTANYKITANTVVEFDFKEVDSAHPSQLYGIGITNDLSGANASLNKAYRLGGSTGPPNSAWSNAQPVSTSGDGTKHYKIAIGQDLTMGLLGLYKYLVFVNSNLGDTTIGVGKSSSFINIRIYDDVAASNLGSLAQQRPKQVERFETSYDALGRPDKHTNADGTSTSTVYDAAGRVRYTIDALGRKTESVYDQFGRLERIVLPDGSYTRFERDDAGNVVKKWDFFGNNGTTNVEYADSFLYDSRNRLATTIRKDGTSIGHVVNPVGQIVASVDGRGNSAYSIYDDRGRVVEQRQADPDGPGSQLAPVTTHKYDEAGNVEASTDTLGNTTTFEYDSLNRLRKESRNDTIIADDSNVVDDIAFVVNFGTRSQTDADGAHGGDVTNIVGTNPQASWTFGDLEPGIYRVAISSVSLASSTGAVVEIPGTSPLVTIPLPQLIPSPDFKTVHGVHGVSWDWLSDANGLPYQISVTSGQSFTIRLKLSGSGALTADAVRIDRVVYSNYEYDKNGNITKSTDTRGNVTDYQYDELGRQTTLTLPDPDALTGNNGGPAGTNLGRLQTQTLYDGYGNRTRTIENRGTTSPDDDRITIYSYDQRNRLIEQIVDHGGAGHENITTTYQYDAAGNRTLVTDPLGFRTHYRYDALNRVVDQYEDYGNRQQPVTRITPADLQAYGFELDGNAGVASNPPVIQNGAVTIGGNAWKSMPLNYMVKHDTVLEFDVDSDWAAALVAIGIDTDNNFNVAAPPEQLYRLGGVDQPAWGNAEFRREDRPDGTVTIYIPIGAYLSAGDQATGLFFSRLVFVNADQRPGLPEADRGYVKFSNIKLYEEFGITPNNLSAYGDLDGVAEVASQPPVIQDRSVTIAGNAWKSVPVTYIVKYNTVLEFEVESNWLAQLHAIGIDTNNYFNVAVPPEQLYHLGGVNPPAWGNIEFRREDRPDGRVTFHIPIGQYLSDGDKALGLAISKLVLVNTDQRPGLADADRGYTKFSSVRLYESDEVRTVTAYDARGNVAAVRTASDPRNITTRYQYDRLGRQTQTTLDDGGPLERQYVTVYDATGNALVEQNPSGASGSDGYVQTVHQYDRLGRLIQTTLPDPDGQAATPNGLVTTFVYDAAGNLIGRTNGEGETTRMAYDAGGRTIGETDGNGDETRYRYDSEGNLRLVIDAAQNITVFTYDGLNRLKTDTIWNSVGSPLTRTNTYNNAGNLAQATDRNGRVRRYEYDTLDRLRFEKWAISGVDVDVLEWQYDDLSRVTYERNGKTLSTIPTAAQNQAIALGVTDPAIDSFAYDGLGRLVEQTNYDASNTSSPSIRQTYQYILVDPSGSFVDETIRTQIRAQFPYDESDVPIAKTVSRYDRLGTLSRVTDSSAGQSWFFPEIKRLQFSYDVAGNLAGITREFQDGAWTPVAPTTFAYDQANRPTSIRHDLATDIVHSYSYDNASRATSFNTTGSGAATRGFGYDDAGQLVSKTGGSAEAYGYDNNGNRTTANGQTVETVFDNRLKSDGNYAYNYDNEGNLTQKLLYGTSTVVATYTWDYRNRLVGFTDVLANPDKVVTYAYDAEDRRVRRTLDPDAAGSQPATSEYFVYDSDDLALQFDNNRELTHRYLYGPQIDQVLVDEVFGEGAGSGERSSEEVLWQLADHQGSIRDVVDNNGTLRKHVDYDSFGKITGELYYDTSGNGVSATNSAAVDQLFGYTGQEWDKDAALANYNARWYDPAMGRFISKDPSGLDGGDANFYRYVGNDPVNHTDPTGLFQAGNPVQNLFASSNFNLNSRAFALGSSNLRLSATPLPSFQSPINANVARQNVVSSPSFGNSVPVLPSGSSLNLPAINYALQQPVSVPPSASHQAAADALHRQVSLQRAQASQPTFIPHELDPNFRGSADAQRRALEAQGVRNAEHLVKTGSPGQAFAGQLALGANDLAGNYHPLNGPLLFWDAVLNNEASATSRLVQGGAGLLDTFFTAYGASSSSRVVSSAGTRTAEVVAPKINAPSNSLNILNREFTPNSSRVLQNLTNQVNTDFIANPRLATTVLSDAELRASVIPGVARMQYGNALERLVAEKIENDTLLKSLYQYNRGAGPDFTGIGPAQGQVFDITTPGQVPAHLARPYGQGLNTIIYQRPAGFP